jgi:hypothetical protein
MWITMRHESEGEGIITTHPWLSSDSTELSVSVFNQDDQSFTCCNNVADAPHAQAYGTFNLSADMAHFIAPSIYCSYTRDDWSATPEDGNIASTLHSNFDTWYPVPESFTVGIPSSGNYLRLTSFSRVQLYLNGSDDRDPAALDQNYVNPRSSIPAGSLGHAVTTLKLNLDLASGLQQLYFCPPPDSVLYSFFTNKPITEIFNWGQAALGGGPLPPTFSDSPPAYLTVEQLTTLLDSINTGFPDCIETFWATTNLRVGPCIV